MKKALLLLVLVLALLLDTWALYPGETAFIGSFEGCDYVDIETDKNFFVFFDDCYARDAVGLEWRCYCYGDKQLDLYVRVKADAGSGFFSVDSFSFVAQPVSWSLQRKRLGEPTMVFIGVDANDVNAGRPADLNMGWRCDENAEKEELELVAEHKACKQELAEEQAKRKKLKAAFDAAVLGRDSWKSLAGWQAATIDVLEQRVALTGNSASVGLVRIGFAVFFASAVWVLLLLLWKFYRRKGIRKGDKLK